MIGTSGSNPLLLKKVTHLRIIQHALCLLHTLSPVALANVATFYNAMVVTEEPNLDPWAQGPQAMRRELLETCFPNREGGWQIR
jgi:hypothetical protein